MKKRIFLKSIIVPIIVAVGCSSFFRISYGQDTLTDLEKLNIQSRIATYVKMAYVDTINVNTLFDGAIHGMIEQLDPHSSYLPPATASDFNERIRGNFQGIGITFSMINNKITVINVIENGPSERAGLKSRDKIVRIENEEVIGISNDDVKNLLRGPANSKVVVHVERPGETDPLRFTITRDEVELNSVFLTYMIDEQTGYIGLTRFSLNTKEDISRALEKLRSQGMQNLVLDLRNNSGGSLDAAIGVVDHFIRDGIIVSTRGKSGNNNMVRRASGSAEYTGIPMIVLINHASASASEIVAGALQDHDRALILGRTSFGKGLVMNQFKLRGADKKKDLGTLILSIAHYYTPSGRLIQRPYINGSRDEYLREGFDDYDPNAIDIDKGDRPIYKTDLERLVYGGGGITPDSTLESNKKLNRLEIALRNTNLFFEFTDEYLLRTTGISGNFEDFLINFQVPDQELNRFKKFAIERGIEIDEVSLFSEELYNLFNKYDLTEESVEEVENKLADMGIDMNEKLFEKSKDFISLEIKMEIARMMWSDEERYRVWHTIDKELLEALSYFDEAADLLAQRLAIGEL